MNEDARVVNLTARELSIIRFAVWRFMGQAHEQAVIAAQKTSPEPVEHVGRWLDDAKDAKKLLAKLPKE